jgi:inhibitor of growth protein 3
MSTQYSLALLQEYAHTLDSLPLELSRNFADLRELDAVLSSSMTAITSKIERLTRMIEEGTAPKEERFWLLTEITEEATRLNLGGDDKIRVACQAADNLKGMFGHLDQLLDRLPGFDKTVVARKTTYPHISLKSFMPPATSDRPSRRRGQASLLAAPIMVAAEPSPVVKRKRPQQDDNLEVTLARSPRKERSSGNPRRSRAKYVSIPVFVPLPYVLNIRKCAQDGPRCITNRVYHLCCIPHATATNEALEEYRQREPGNSPCPRS